jgi:beta-lactam-binding protein with PASTA domain
LAEVADKGLVKSSNPVAETVVSPGRAVDLVVYDTIRVN